MMTSQNKFDFDKLKKKIEDNDFLDPQNTWVKIVWDFLRRYLGDAIILKHDIIQRQNKINLLKRLTKDAFELPEPVVEMMVPNMKQMAISEIDNLIQQYRVRIANKRVQSGTFSEGSFERPSTSTSMTPSAPVPVPSNKKDPKIAELYLRLQRYSPSELLTTQKMMLYEVIETIKEMEADIENLKNSC